MWLITTSGFLSIVRNLNSTRPDDALLVRGRVRADLERFADFAARRGARPTVVESPDADYGFRLTTSREVLAAFVAERVAALDYPNFKSEVAKADPQRAHAYMDVWSALRGLQGRRG
ncbi:MAG: hypothetical protein IPL89_12085 [Acidobacteria bacterium]|nr:hypothetical protein [Acidobacteriota bacterium]